MNAPAMSDPFARLVRMAAKWGVRVVFDELPLDCVGQPYDDAPAAVAELYWRQRVIHWRDECTIEEAEQFVHELAHAIVARHPRIVDEGSEGPLLFVEYALTRACKIGRGGMSQYIIDERREWPTFSTRQRHDFLARSRKLAVRGRLVTRDGRFTYYQEPRS